MLLRAVLEFVFVLLAVRAVWRLIGGILQGLTNQSRGPRSAQPAVTMVRDPVCGTFVLPDRALTISDGRARVHFCSPDCRDKYRSRTA
jgi:YHS domain-containing protein